MLPEVRERLGHIITAGETIVEAAGASFADYEADKIRKYAVERLFTIVGEALREALRLQPDLASVITGHRRIVDFRNVLVHGYATVYDEGVWRIIEEHLPILLAEVRALLATSDEPA
ncbi:MAG TPA: HepT-like ribonuclease domain-containing protein [Thermoanaerobaculia bacterium]